MVKTLPQKAVTSYLILITTRDQHQKSLIKINISCNTEPIYFDVKYPLSLLYPQYHELQNRSAAKQLI